MKIEILTNHLYLLRGSRSRDRMVVEFMTPMQSVPITTKVVSSNPAHGEVYYI
jgi:hypothetical protein